MRKRKFVNPPVGTYVGPKGNIFVLARKDGPYPLAYGHGEVSLYLFIDKSGRWPKTVIAEPFNAVRLGGVPRDLR